MRMSEKQQNLMQLFAAVENYFSPKIVGEVNNAYIKVAKIKGQDIPWHTHENEDEMFYVFKGSLVIQRKGAADIRLKEGEFFIVKKGVEHRVNSDYECWIMLIENKTTKHTGEVKSQITRTIDEQFY
jgi:quercetin dioxygenase-like cupin family protein